MSVSSALANDGDDAAALRKGTTVPLITTASGTRSFKTFADLVAKNIKADANAEYQINVENHVVNPVADLAFAQGTVLASLLKSIFAGATPKNIDVADTYMTAHSTTVAGGFLSEADAAYYRAIKAILHELNKVPAFAALPALSETPTAAEQTAYDTAKAANIAT